MPLMFGSGGGNSNNVSLGMGGGIFQFNSKRVIVDGTITASGLQGDGSRGGGSGGSMVFTVDEMEGHGVVQV